ncbi:hypothetical protein E2C01_030272 [Portunus trituberculatus]|uniref:Uncharacterized protein n=1 Tax=Portunus trituberculatus TaxID=210409 RepID=A0A5B7ETT3_PORTR|nr:hypothetical protein [Portunus trituberculatus]
MLQVVEGPGYSKKYCVISIDFLGVGGLYELLLSGALKGLCRAPAPHKQTRTIVEAGASKAKPP